MILKSIICRYKKFKDISKNWDFKSKVIVFIEMFSPIYINLYNIFTEYFKARKVYVFPKVKWHFNDNCGWQHDMPEWRILNIEAFPLGWKHKWDNIQFEKCPRVILSVFNNKWAIECELQSPVNNINSNYPDNELYWESMLNYLYKYNKDIVKTKNTWGWQTPIEDSDGNAVWVNTWSNLIIKEKWRKQFSV